MGLVSDRHRNRIFTQKKDRSTFPVWEAPAFITYS